MCLSPKTATIYPFRQHHPLILLPFWQCLHLGHCDVPSRLQCLWCLCQIDDTEVINFLLSTEIIPLCLKTMEMGSELSKTVATFIVQKILIDQASNATSHPLQ